MDYLVAHLLRVLQETVEWNAPRGKLPACIRSAGIWAENVKVPLHETVVVEETIFRVMHTLMSTYGLRHMYWPGKYIFVIPTYLSLRKRSFFLTSLCNIHQNCVL